jgi:peptidoglycan/xylan/chitin deacetylase (PgdA/CDA1 family)
VKEVVITIDDAPSFSQNTSKILDVLKKHNVRATMFCIGQYLEQYPDLAQRIAKEQTMANHSYSHFNFKDRDKSMLFEQELYKNQVLVDAINISVGKPTNKLFRFPYGACTDNEINYLLDYGFTVCWWDLDASDWDNNVSIESIMNYYDTHLYNKTEIPIILFHLSDNSIIALDRLLYKFEKRGIKVISLQEKLIKK